MGLSEGARVNDVVMGKLKDNGVGLREVEAESLRNTPLPFELRPGLTP